MNQTMEKLRYDPRYRSVTIDGDTLADFEWGDYADKYGPMFAAAPRMVKLLKKASMALLLIGRGGEVMNEIDTLLAEIEGGK